MNYEILNMVKNNNLHGFLLIEIFFYNLSLALHSKNILFLHNLLGSRLFCLKFKFYFKDYLDCD